MPDNGSTLRNFFAKLGPKKAPVTRRQGETVAFKVTQTGNVVIIEGDRIRIDFAVEGIQLPPQVDPSFAVWALLPRAMEEGFDIHIPHPIDPKVKANAERLARIWEMWVPSRYRSIKVSGEGEWSRIQNHRLPFIHFYSGGVDSTYSILQFSNNDSPAYVLTIDGFDYRGDWGPGAFHKLIVKTDPLLEKLNYRRIVIRTNAGCRPFKFTAGFSLASCAFLLSDLFEGSTLAADHSPEQDMALIWPYLLGPAIMLPIHILLAQILACGPSLRLAVWKNSQPSLRVRSHCLFYPFVASMM